MTVDCPLCARPYASILEHIKRQHTGRRLTSAQLVLTGLHSCVCGALAISGQGIKTHQGKSKCAGWARARSSSSSSSPVPAAPPAAPVAPPAASSSARRRRASLSSESSLELPIRRPRPATRRRAASISSDGSSLLRVQVGSPSVASDDDAAGWPSSSPSSSPSPAPDGLVNRFASLAACPTVYKPLPASWAKPFVAAAAACARAYLEQPSEQAIFDFLCLPKVGLGPALKLAASASGSVGKAHLAAFPLVDWPQPGPPPSSSSSIPARVAKAIEQGKLSRAARLLADDTSVAPLDDGTVDSLRAKHPVGQLDPFGARIGTPPSSLPDLALVRNCFAAFKPDTAPGVSGWTPPLLGHALGDPDVAAFVVLLTRHVAQGTAPGQQLLCTSRLTPLLKADGGIRPIAVGELLYRLVAKSLVRHFSAPSQLLPWQFGVGSPGGTEPITRAIERAVDFDLPAPYRHVTSLDFSNAFNSLRRAQVGKGLLQHAPALYRAGRWAYNVATPLIVSAAAGDPVVLSSSEGVRQGDPLGPLLFSVGARNTLAALQAHLGDGHLLLAYLDDVYVLSVEPGALDSVAAFLDGNDAGLALNLAKCAETPLGVVAQDGLEVLGTCIGPPDVRAAFLARQVDAQLPALARLADLPGQEALLLLRHCLSANLRHLQRSLRTDDLPDAWAQLDEALLDRFLAIRSSPRRLVSDAGLVSLPARLGGMGLLSHAEVAPLARAAMAEAADVQLKPVLAASHPAGEPVDDDDEEAPQPTSQRNRCQAAFLARRESLLASLPESNRAAVLDNASPIARRWLSAIPFAANLRLSSSEVAAGLSIRTLCPGQDDHCSHCSLPNVHGHDDVCSARPQWRVARHEHVKALLAQHLGAVPRTRVQLEPFVPGSHQRTDLRLTGPASFGGPISEYDVSVVSAATLAGRSPVALAQQPALPSSLLPAGLSPDSAPHTAVASSSLLHHLTITENEKRSKYDGRTSSPFHPVVISTGGTLSPSTVSLFAYWRGLMPRYGLFSRLLSLALLRARARFFAF